MSSIFRRNVSQKKCGEDTQVMSKNAESAALIGKSQLSHLVRPSTTPVCAFLKTQDLRQEFCAGK